MTGVKNETAADASNIAAAEENLQRDNASAKAETQENEPAEAVQIAIAAIAKLADLPTVEYSLKRKEAAKALGVNVTDLDREVIAARRAKAVQTAGGELDVHDPEPWVEGEVDGAELLDQFAAEISRHTILPPQAVDAVALWILNTYVHDCFTISPRLLLTSPDKRCGKSTLLGIVQQLALRAVTTANATPASIFRLIEDVKPTLLIDEADTFLEAMTEGRGIINSGHVKTSAYVIRNVGEDFKTKRFSTWAPMLIAQIGRPASTLVDRSIVVELKRKRIEDEVDKVNLASPLYPELRSKAQRWKLDHQEALPTLKPAVPSILHDRAKDNWLPLAAIAQEVGRSWPERMAEAARYLSMAEAASDASHGAMVLADIKAVFDVEAEPRMASKDLLKQLTDLDHRPWAEWRHGKPLSQAQLAKLLAPFGIRSRNVRIGAEQFKGYAVEDFDDAFERYLT